MKHKTLLIGTVVLLLLIFVVATLAYKSEKIDQSVQLAAANSAALVRMHSPTLGRTDAPVVIVEFLDPACETCAALYPLVKGLMAEHPGKIRLVLRYAPFHTGSDKVVAVLEAARLQGKFWPALEALLSTQHHWAPHHTVQVARVWPHLEGLGLNLEQLRADMLAPAIAQVIAQDLADADTLKVSKTPEFFVNGKPLPRFGFDQLKKLVDEALKDAQRR
ncbi:MAG: thioredoxin domain-containing protein [Rhodocyclaceae bacterium]|nr:thioredoxin domain-containing protein [Rhodocyclaceae bacterium]MDP1956651.1 thioredoxin domain-containing protein [Rhodocyclaceae bacterium]